ncbi:hypothetical protein AN958_03445 [Leucoagaricus sp. SymC.cos]|nr:hypothetical protein AN958_03445 [Leucoagaricus sp. SymC.cos]
MLQRHRRLSFSLEIYREILAPISHVPYEILQQIFRHTVPPGFVTPSVNRAPLLLTMVCRKWRSITLSTPSLWSSISTTSDWPLQVFLPQPSLSNIDKFFRSLFRRPYLMLPSQPLLWIERARNAPLHMEITIPKKDYWFGTLIRITTGWFRPPSVGITFVSQLGPSTWHCSFPSLCPNSGCWN